MKCILTFLVVACIFLLSSSVLASSQKGKVKKLYVRASDGLVYLYLDTSPPEDKPACAKNPYWMIKDENSEVGKKQYSMLLAAHSAGRTISISGTGYCTRWSDGEDINSVVMLPINQ